MRKCCVFILCLLLLAGIMMVRPTTAYATENGWDGDDENGWYYYENGEAVTGWKIISGKTYYFSEYGGYMYRDGIMTVNDKLYYFNEKGHLQGVGGGWIKRTYSYDGTETWEDWYYANKDGSLTTLWKQIDGKWYYFNEYNGSMYSGGNYSIGENTYFFNEKGELQGANGGWICDKHSYTSSDGTVNTWENWFYAKKGGALVSGWQKIDGKWYYFDEYGGMYSNGTYEIDGSRYMFHEKGHMLGQGGGWIEDLYTWGDSDWYFANGDGSIVTGWKQIGGKWYYFAEYNGRMYSDGSYEIDGKRYAFNKDGHMLGQGGGWVKDETEWGENWFFSNSDGSLISGWKQIGGTWYYFDEYGYMMSNGSDVIDGTPYAFGEDGAMLGRNGGWVKITPNRWWYDSQNKEHKEAGEPPMWYYAEKGGALVTGWKKLDGVWYYFGENGRMATGTVRTEDGTYQCDPNTGALLGSAGGWTKVEHSYMYYDGTGRKVVEPREYWIFTEKGGKAVENGWKTIGGKTYAFINGRMAQSGTAHVDDKVYVFDKDGTLSKGGWVEGITSGGKTSWYYANSDGTAKTGWVKSGSKWYYIGEGYMYRGSIFDGDKEYILTDDGTLSTGGVVSIARSTMAIPYKYYANADGTAAIGWQKIDGKWYYFDSYMIYDTERVIDGERHKFAVDGTWMGTV